MSFLTANLAGMARQISRDIDMDVVVMNTTGDPGGRQARRAGAGDWRLQPGAGPVSGQCRAGG